MSEIVNFTDFHERTRLTEFEEFCVGNWGLYLQFKRVLQHASAMPLTKLVQLVMEICRKSWEIPIESRRAPTTLRCQAAARLIEMMDQTSEEKALLQNKIVLLNQKMEHQRFREQLRVTERNQRIFQLEKENEDLKKQVQYLKAMTPEKRRKIDEL